MKLNQADIDSANNRHFRILKDRVKRRQQSGRDLAWLLETPHSLPYRPDYLPLRSAGKNRFQQRLNRVISASSRSLWFRLFWPKIRQGLVSYTEHSYLPKVFQQLQMASERGELTQTITRGLREVMGYFWTELPDCTFSELSNCLLAIIHEPFRQLECREDVFAGEKRRQNKTCLSLLHEIDSRLKSHPRRLQILLQLCCRSNWIDSLEDDSERFLETFHLEIEDMLADGEQSRLLFRDNPFFQFKWLENRVHGTPLTILYELDNCGEVVFDLKLVEYLVSEGHRCVLCVKSCPMVNDVTAEDLDELLKQPLLSGLNRARTDERLSVITSGPFIGGGKLVHDISLEYQKTYPQVDLLIVKGQGNFQSMPMGVRQHGRFYPYPYRKPVVFMTGIKSDMVMMCLKVLFPFGKEPRRQSPFLFCFDPEDPSTYP
ncbi:protein-glutamate O-methyltransferase family protein [bacterium]|nr:protein-glutamate O-methyltransferase family protein [bacterium]